MGAAELAGLLRDYHGSYLLVFAGYNAGHGQVEKWIERVRRSARPQDRPDRLGRADSVCRDAQLRSARNGEPASLSRAVRQRYAVATAGENVKLVSVFLEGRFVRVWSWCGTGVVGTAPSSANWRRRLRVRTIRKERA